MLSSAVAAGATPTRAEYVERAEGICKASKDRTEPTLKGVGADINNERFKIAGRKLLRAASQFEGQYGSLLALPKPKADADLLTTWLKRLKTQNSLMETSGELMVAERKSKVQGYLARYAHAGNLANNTVLGFGFDYCLFRFSKLPQI